MTKAQLEEQFTELYDKFPEVKAYYNFVFNPREEKLIGEAKAKISNEYFPTKTKRAKLRRSVAQKFLKQFLLLGVDPYLIADLMLFNIETAQKYSARREMRYSSFYSSLQKSFEQAVKYAISAGIASDFRERLKAISLEAHRQKWENRNAFDLALEVFDE